MGKRINSNQKAERDGWYSVWFCNVRNIDTDPLSSLVFHIRAPLQTSSPQPRNHYFAINLNFLKT